MGQIKKIYCSECGFATQTRGLDEFYRDKNGDAKFYGHPKPASEEAIEAGFLGFMADVLCLGCGKTIQNYIMKELVHPVKEGEDTINCEVKKKYSPKGNLCPNCNGKLVFMLREKNPDKEPDVDTLGTVKCPKCKNGILRQTWVKIY